MRLNKKDISKPDDRLRVPHQQQADIELEQIEIQPPENTSARPKRNTRSRAAKATSSDNTKAEPVRHSTRATSRRAAAKAAQKRIEDSFSEEQGDKLSVKERDSGFTEGESGSMKPKRESISLQQVKMSVCKVSLEKVVSPMTTLTPDAKATPPPIETDGRTVELTVKDEQPGMEEMEASSSHETTQSTTIGMGLTNQPLLIHTYSLQPIFLMARCLHRCAWLT